MMRLASSATLSVLLGGCTVSASLDGKKCPCVDGYVCDEALDQCVEQTCEPAVTVTDLSAAWSTTNHIRFRWQVEGSADDFSRYELVVAESKEDIASRSGTARIYDASTNPELGGLVRPQVGGVVDGTTAQGLDPATSYVAQLQAVDANLCTFGSSVVARSTLPTLAGLITLFRDEVPVGAELAPGPPALELVTTGTEGHLAYSALDDEDCTPDTLDLEDVQAVCGQPLRLRNLDMDVSRDPAQPAANALRENSFGTAFLEMRVSNVAPVHSWFSVIWLRFDDCATEEEIYRWDGWTLRSDGDYATVQVPLAELGNGERMLTYADLDNQAAGTPLCGFAIGGGWHKTSEVQIDDVVIHY